MMRKFFASALLIALAGCGKGSGTKSTGVRSEHNAPAGPGLVQVDSAIISSGQITIAQVTRRSPVVERRVTGEVRADEAASAEAGTLVAGRVAALVVKEGARVERGQLLAWVDSPDASRAAAEVLRARARSDVAAKRLSRQLLLEEQRATSAGSVEDARAEDAMARADLAAARTLLATFGVSEPLQADENRGLTVRVPVRAPIAGTIVERHAVLGAAVHPDTTLFHIVAGHGVFVSANVPETELPPPDGSTALVVGRGDESLRCSAVVEGNLRVVDNSSRTVAVRLQPDAACGWLSPGRYVDVTFSIAQGDPSLVVPPEAIVDVNGVSTAFVATDKTGVFAARQVRVRTTGGPDQIVESGLAEGDRIATQGTLLLKGELLRATLEGQ